MKVAVFARSHCANDAFSARSLERGAGFPNKSPSTLLANRDRTVARHRRSFISGVTQHVIQRGNNRIAIFRSPGDYAKFLNALHDASVRYPIKIHAYALMTNHVHLMLTPDSANALSAAMQAVGRKYVRYFNHRYERTGGLFDGRFRSMMVDSEVYWLTCMRYVEFNPVRAGLVAMPEEYRWSSYPAHAFGEPNALLVPHSLYLGLGHTPALRQQAWRAICGKPLPDDQLHRIRTALFRGHTGEIWESRGQTPGSDPRV